MRSEGGEGREVVGGLDPVQGAPNQLVPASSTLIWLLLTASQHTATLSASLLQVHHKLAVELMPQYSAMGTPDES